MIFWTSLCGPLRASACARLCTLGAAGFLMFSAMIGAPAVAATPDVIDVGHAKLVKNSVFGNLGGQTRHVVLKERVYFNEEIITGLDSATQIVFADDSVLTMGPNARMVLDEMVYDPSDPDISKMSISLAQGVFSFVSGRMHSAAYSVNTPTTTIGLRGTAFSVAVKPDGTSAVVLSQGIVTATNGAGQTVGLIEPGLATVVEAPPPGAAADAPPPPPSAPMPPPADVAAEIGQMNGLVQAAAQEAGVTVAVLPPPTETSAPLGPKNAPSEPVAVDAADSPAIVTEQSGEIGAGQGSDPFVGIETVGAIGSNVTVKQEYDTEKAKKKYENETTVAASPEGVADVLKTYAVTVDSDTGVTMTLHVNETSGAVYGRYYGPIKGMDAIGVFNGTVTEGVVTGQIHIQPADLVGSGTNGYYHKGNASFDLTTGAASTASLLSLIDDSPALTWTGSHTLSWSAVTETTNTVVGPDTSGGTPPALTMYYSNHGINNTGSFGALGVGQGTIDPSTGALTLFSTARTASNVEVGDKVGGAVIEDTNGYTFFGVSPDSIAAGYEHLAWGEYGHLPLDFATSSGAYGSNPLMSNWIAGEAIDHTTLSGSLGPVTATYNGIMRGGYYGGSGDPVGLTGTISVSADISAQTYTGSFNLGAATAGDFVTGGALSGTWNTSGEIIGSMTGTAGGEAISGSAMNGGFFGDGSEIGGGWALQTTSNKAAGIYAAKKTP